jgi:hypothetical protein
MSNPISPSARSPETQKERLTQLIAQWREQAAGWRRCARAETRFTGGRTDADARAHEYSACADQLEAALAADPGQGEPPQDEEVERYLAALPWSRNAHRNGTKSTTEENIRTFVRWLRGELPGIAAPARTVQAEPAPQADESVPAKNIPALIVALTLMADEQAERYRSDIRSSAEAREESVDAQRREDILRSSALALKSASLGRETRVPHPPAWTCFHCSETFTDEAAAREHFGNDEASAVACRVAEADGGLLKALRESEREVGALRNANEQLDHEAGAYHAMSSELERKFGTGVRSAYQAWLRLEAMESRAMAAEEALAAARQETPAVPPTWKVEADRVDVWICLNGMENCESWEARRAHRTRLEQLLGITDLDAAPSSVSAPSVKEGGE